MTVIEERKALAPWTEALPPDWRTTRLDAVADVLFSNVDKHTIEGEVPVRLCNYVDVYNNERITGALDFMEASAEPREIKKFQIRPGDTLATKDSEEPDDIAIPALVVEELPGVLCGYHLALIRPRLSTVSGPFSNVASFMQVLPRPVRSQGSRRNALWTPRVRLQSGTCAASAAARATASCGVSGCDLCGD